MNRNTNTFSGFSLAIFFPFSQNLNFSPRFQNNEHREFLTTDLLAPRLILLPSLLFVMNHSIKLGKVHYCAILYSFFDIQILIMVTLRPLALFN